MSAVDNIVQNFNKLDQTSDFSGVASQLIDLQKQSRNSWKQNIDEINRQVDMKALGFPEDFRIIGVNEKGRLLTTSEDGRRLQERDLSHMAVKSERPNHMEVERRGNRDFFKNSDNSGSYVTKQGDTLWSIAKETLKAENGKTPTNSEIANAVKAIARENNISDPNKIGVGQEIRIGVSAPRPEYPKALAPELKPSDSAVAPKLSDRTTNPITPPGLGPETETREWGIRNRQVVSRDRSEGHTTTRYEGAVNDGVLGMFDTKFQSERTVGQNGQLIKESVQYANKGTDLTFDNGKNGTVRVDNVTQIETRFNSESGKYESMVTDLDGSKYRITTGQSGHTEKFETVHKIPKYYPPIPMSP